MKNSKNKRTMIMVGVLVGLLVVAYKVVFMPPVDKDLLTSGNIVAGEKVESLLKEIETINFDVSIIKDPMLTSLRSIEAPLLSLPVGKKNPFSVISN